MSIQGLENFGSEDMVLSRRSMVQGTSKVDDIDGAYPGMFIDETSRSLIGKQMTVAVLAVKKNRALFFDLNSGQKGLKCWSKDSITPNAENPVASTCAACPEAARDMQYDLICYDVEASRNTGAPVVFQLRAKGTSLFPTRTYISTLLQRKRRAFDFVVTITCPKANSKKGSYNVLNFSDITVTPDDLLAEIEAAYETYVAGDSAEVGDSATTTDESFEGDGAPF